MGADQCNRSQRLLDLGEKGVYPSYTHLHLADHLPVAHDHAGTRPPLVPVAAA
jgi:hypothetical protein